MLSYKYKLLKLKQNETHSGYHLIWEVVSLLNSTGTNAKLE